MVALALSLLPLACGVPRADRATVDRSDYSTLPNLRRAQEELEAQIVREEEHVQALIQRNLSLRADEAETYKQTLAAEEDYQLRLADLAAVQADLDRANVELAAVQAALAEARTQHAALQAEMQRVHDELADLALLVERGRVALDALPEELRALLAEMPARETAPGTAPAEGAGDEELPAAASGGEADEEAAADAEPTGDDDDANEDADADAAAEGSGEDADGEHGSDADEESEAGEGSDDSKRT